MEKTILVASEAQGDHCAVQGLPGDQLVLGDVAQTEPEASARVGGSKNSSARPIWIGRQRARFFCFGEANRFTHTGRCFCYIWGNLIKSKAEKNKRIAKWDHLFEASALQVEAEVSGFN